MKYFKLYFFVSIFILNFVCIGCDTVPNRIQAKTLKDKTKRKVIKGMKIQKIKCWDTLLNPNYVKVCEDDKHNRLLLICQDKDTVFKHSLSKDMDGYSVKVENFNDDNFQDIIIEMTDNRSCNYVFLLNDSKPVMIDDCSKYNSLERININSKVYYATYKNLGCASAVYETKLIKFNGFNEEVIYEVFVYDCENNPKRIEVKKNGRIIKTLNTEKFKKYFYENEIFWNLILKEIE